MSSRDNNAVVHDQPKPSIPMTPKNAQNSNGGDRNALKVPVMDDGLRTWSHGLFDCFSNCRLCALSTCCCCYVYGWNMRRFNQLETQGVPLREPFEMRTSPGCEGHCSLGKAAPVLQAISRRNIRRRYGIRGDNADDLLASGCVPCALVQEHREIQLEESSFN